VATWHWSIGFNWNSTALSLQTVFVSDDNNAVATPVNLSTGDTVHFYVFDVTSSNGASTTDKTISDGTVSFANADTTIQSITTSPFSSTRLDTGPSPSSSATPVSDPAFSPNATLTYPRWEILVPRTIVNNGRFEMTISLTVTDGTTIKAFTQDPEMVVGGFG
jgi:protein involved in polysaccharide export with SLBB domain